MCENTHTHTHIHKHKNQPSTILQSRLLLFASIFLRFSWFLYVFFSIKSLLIVVLKIAKLSAAKWPMCSLQLECDLQPSVSFSVIKHKCGMFLQKPPKQISGENKLVNHEVAKYMSRRLFFQRICQIFFGRKSFLWWKRKKKEKGRTQWNISVSLCCKEQ